MTQRLSLSLSYLGCHTKAMWDSTSNSDSLIGEPTITSAPPLILLQSEDGGVDQGKSSGADGAAGVVQARENSESATTDTIRFCPPPDQSLLPSSHNWNSAEGLSCVPTTQSLPDVWNLDQVLSEVGLYTFDLNHSNVRLCMAVMVLIELYSLIVYHFQ